MPHRSRKPIPHPIQHAEISKLNLSSAQLQGGIVILDQGRRFLSEILSEYDLKIPQSQTADKPMAS